MQDYVGSTEVPTLQVRAPARREQPLPLAAHIKPANATPQLQHRTSTISHPNLDDIEDSLHKHAQHDSCETAQTDSLRPSIRVLAYIASGSTDHSAIPKSRELEMLLVRPISLDRLLIIAVRKVSTYQNHVISTQLEASFLEASV